MSMEQIDDRKELEAIVDAVQDEWEYGGLGPETIYGEFAVEVARRAVSAERERIKAALMDMHDKTSGRHNYFHCAAVEFFGNGDVRAET